MDKIKTMSDKEFTVDDMTRLKGVAIVCMIFLHLFNRDWEGVYQPLLFVGGQPIYFLISFFTDICVPVYLFCSGYGLYVSYSKNQELYGKGNLTRIKKLLINYWIILILFPVLLGFILQKDGYPGDLLKFILNLFALDTSYSSIWWFLTIYIILVIISPILFFIVRLYSIWIVLPVSFLIFVLGHFQRYNTLLHSDIQTVNWLCNKLALIGTSQFAFLIGTYFRKYNFYSKFINWFYKLKFFNVLAFLGILLLIVLRMVIKTNLMASFTAIPFIILFTAVDLKGLWISIWNFFGKHSTNVWLVHEYFYEIFFKKELIALKYAPIQLLGVLAVSISSSFFINFINKKVQKFI